MKVEISPGPPEDVVLRFPSRNWELAANVVASIRQKPPVGYRVTLGKITPRGRSGTRCNVTVVMRHVLIHEPRMDEDEVHEHFEPFALAAQGVPEVE